MDLRQKLARLNSPQRAPLDAELELDSDGDAEREAKLAELRALIGGVVSRSERRARVARETLRSVDRALPWAPIDTAHGPLHRVERYLEAHHCHGRAPVASALTPSPRTLAALTLDPSLAGIDLSRMLLLDTETTGLSGGTGTVAFLIGLGTFDEGLVDDIPAEQPAALRRLRLEQLVLPNLGGELPMLAHLAQRLREASCIVTYNGKAFDWPLLRTRFVLARMPVPPLPPHVDLLHTARRIWKPRLSNVRLTDIEREILRFEREGDIDGAEIPGRYFAFLREGGGDRLVPVIEHNQNDLIALAAMLGVLGERFERGELDVPVEDALAFARLAARASESERALSFTQAVLEGAAADVHSRAALLLAGDVQRKAGDSEAAARALEDALAFCPSIHDAAPLHLALAKLYERGLRDALRAHTHARHTEPVEGPEAHGRRLGRLRRRLLKQADAAAS
ncbi:MAG TPA: ribonuclease H-like domain-containing protein [Polyangiales bacterium]|jgi:uncharacterized protein YprB with RNaseH-like and TPR domain|nr:ribonuclease H-like domain-containing protein [Polyangiales bacterium]